MAFNSDFTPLEGCPEEAAHRVRARSATHDSEGWVGAAQRKMVCTLYPGQNKQHMYTPELGGSTVSAPGQVPARGRGAG